MRNLFSFIAILIFPFALCAQEKIVATGYELKSKQTEKLFNLTFEITGKDGETQIQSDFRDMNGKALVAEKGLIKGDELINYEISRPQTEEKGSISIREGQIFFSYEGPGGKKKSADEKVKGKVLCASSFTAFVINHFDELSNGKALDIRFAVWDRLETVGFTIKKVGDSEKDGAKLLELQMKPTSFVIAVLVDPVHFWYDYSDKHLKVMKGRVAPKKGSAGKWKDLDAEVVYTYVQNSVSK